jgi:hypothetical protein
MRLSRCVCQFPEESLGQTPPRHLSVYRAVGLGCVAGVLILACASAAAQDLPPPGSPDRPYLVPNANRLPDVNDQMVMRERLSKKENFDAANTLRAKEIADDTMKLLILTKDLKAQMNQLGSAPLSSRLIREAEVIEILARDIQTKMKLTVGSG